MTDIAPETTDPDDEATEPVESDPADADASDETTDDDTEPKTEEAPADDEPAEGDTDESPDEPDPEPDPDQDDDQDDEDEPEEEAPEFYAVAVALDMESDDTKGPRYHHARAKVAETIHKHFGDADWHPTFHAFVFYVSAEVARKAVKAKFRGQPVSFDFYDEED